MRTCVFSCCRNEADIIEAWVRHHCAVADKVVVMDNGSTDDTTEILRMLEQESLPLEVIYEKPQAGYAQINTMSALLRRCKGQADWLCPLDADEFLYPGFDWPPMPCVVAMEWRHYAPLNHWDISNPVERIQHRAKTETFHYLHKVAVHGSLVGLDTSFERGQHFLKKAGVNMPDVPGRPIAHFPARNPHQVARKIAVCILQHIWEKSYTPTDGYRPGFDALVKNPADFAMNWVSYGWPGLEAGMLQPFPYQGGPIKYPYKVPCTEMVLSHVLAFAEQMAWEYPATG